MKTSLIQASRNFANASEKGEEK